MKIEGKKRKVVLCEQVAGQYSCLAEPCTLSCQSSLYSHYILIVTIFHVHEFSTLSVLV